MRELSPADDLLLARLAHLLAEVQPVPPSVLAAAEAAGELLTGEVELRLLDDPALLAVRGVARRRLRLGVGATLVADVELTEELVAGLIDPGFGVETVELCWPRGSVVAGTGDLGYFRASPPRGAGVRAPVRLVLRGRGRCLASGWIDG